MTHRAPAPTTAKLGHQLLGLRSQHLPLRVGDVRRVARGAASTPASQHRTTGRLGRDKVHRTPQGLLDSGVGSTTPPLPGVPSRTWPRHADVTKSLPTTRRARRVHCGLPTGSNVEKVHVERPVICPGLPSLSPARGSGAVMIEIRAGRCLTARGPRAQRPRRCPSGHDLIERGIDLLQRGCGLHRRPRSWLVPSCWINSLPLLVCRPKRTT